MHAMTVLLLTTAVAGGGQWPHNSVTNRPTANNRTANPQSQPQPPTSSAVSAAPTPVNQHAAPVGFDNEFRPQPIVSRVPLAQDGPWPEEPTNQEDWDQTAPQRTYIPPSANLGPDPGTTSVPPAGFPETTTPRFQSAPPPMDRTHVPPNQDSSRDSFERNEFQRESLLREEMDPDRVRGERQLIDERRSLDERLIYDEPSRRNQRQGVEDQYVRPNEENIRNLEPASRPRSLIAAAPTNDDPRNAQRGAVLTDMPELNEVRQPGSPRETNRQAAYREPPRSGNSQFFTLLVLFGSIGMNIYLGWIAWDTYNRYQDLVSDVRYTNSRRSANFERSVERQSSVVETAAY